MQVSWHGTYELHYTPAAETTRATGEGLFFVYFPLSRETFAGRFLPVPGLGDRRSPDFDPAARVIDGRHSPARRFSVSLGCIRSDGDLPDIVARLADSGGIHHVLEKTGPPPLRWDHIDLAPLPLPAGLAEYCAALRGRFANGFVECRQYGIPPGPVEDRVMERKGAWTSPAIFAEVFRHPMIAVDFSVKDPDEACLMTLGSWVRYSPFLTSGYFAETLAAGGAYRPTRDAADIASCLDLAERAFAALNRGHANFELFVCRAAWCSRFCGIAWDHTWIALDHQARRITVMMGSDTD